MILDTILLTTFLFLLALPGAMLIVAALLARHPRG